MLPRMNTITRSLNQVFQYAHGVFPVLNRCYHFQKLKTGGFSQVPPTLQNQYDSDWFLQLWLQTNLPKEVRCCC